MRPTGLIGYGRVRSALDSPVRDPCQIALSNRGCKVIQPAALQNAGGGQLEGFVFGPMQGLC